MQRGGPHFVRPTLRPVVAELARVPTLTQRARPNSGEFGYMNAIAKVRTCRNKKFERDWTSCSRSSRRGRPSRVTSRPGTGAGEPEGEIGRVGEGEKRTAVRRWR